MRDLLKILKKKFGVKTAVIIMDGGDDPEKTKEPLSRRFVRDMTKKLVQSNDNIRKALPKSEATG